MGNWRDMLTYPDSIDNVKAQEIPAAVKKYLDPAFMTIGCFRPIPPPSRDDGTL